MWVKFTKDFDFSPEARNGHVTVAYKAGMELNVTAICAEQAIAAKKAVKVKKTGKVSGEG